MYKSKRRWHVPTVKSSVVTVDIRGTMTESKNSPAESEGSFTRARMRARPTFENADAKNDQIFQLLGLCHFALEIFLITTAIQSSTRFSVISMRTVRYGTVR